jgi:hypothetical protein
VGIEPAWARRLLRPTFASIHTVDLRAFAFVTEPRRTRRSPGSHDEATRADA